MLLYHSTFNAYLDSILRDGLLADPPVHNWSWADEYAVGDSNGGVFFATDPDLAISFAETADDVSDDVYDSGIALLSIESASLDPDLLLPDPFFDPDGDDGGSEAICFLYAGDVPPSAIVVASMR